MHYKIDIGFLVKMFWFDSIWILYIENAASIFRDDINFKRYYPE